MTEDFTQLCKLLEHFETPEWAARAILEKETLEPLTLDPCCGSGILSETAHRLGYKVHATDIYDYGYGGMAHTGDFLECDRFIHAGTFGVFMNPPFSLACQFVEKSLELGARKIICFQRFAWWESRKRRDFWRAHPPARVYICGDRADCWRHDIPPEKRTSSSPTAHAWFVWERGHDGDTTLHHIWKDGK